LLETEGLLAQKQEGFPIEIDQRISAVHTSAFSSCSVAEKIGHDVMFSDLCESGGPFLSTVAIQLHDAPVSCRCSHFHMEVHFFFHPQNRTTPQETLKELAQHCDEFLVHAVDVEGKMSGIEEPLVEVLATSPIPVTCPRSCWTRDGLDPATEALDPSWRRLVEREVMLSKVKLKTYIREL
jgi:hypothetical protein